MTVWPKTDIQFVIIKELIDDFDYDNIIFRYENKVLFTGSEDLKDMLAAAESKRNNLYEKTNDIAF